MYLSTIPFSCWRSLLYIRPNLHPKSHINRDLTDKIATFCQAHFFYCYCHHPIFSVSEIWRFILNVYLAFFKTFTFFQYLNKQHHYLFGWSAWQFLFKAISVVHLSTRTVHLSQISSFHLDWRFFIFGLGLWQFVTVEIQRKKSRLSA